MSNSKNSDPPSSSLVLGFIGVVSATFIVFKIVSFRGDTIHSWPWWWVLSPLWVAALLGIAVLIVSWSSFGVYLLIKHRGPHGK